MILFIIGQLFINYKHGMVVSPFLHYGMYSDVIKIEKEYGVFEVVINGKKLQGKDFSPQQWDKILLPLYYFKNINTGNQMYQSDIKRLLLVVHLSASEKHFLQDCNLLQFQKWYKEYLPAVIDVPINSIEINYRKYNYTEGKLVPVNSVATLSQLCY